MAKCAMSVTPATAASTSTPSSGTSSVRLDLRGRLVLPARVVLQGRVGPPARQVRLARLELQVLPARLGRPGRVGQPGRLAPPRLRLRSCDLSILLRGACPP